MKRITFIFAALTVACLLQAQQTDVKKRFVATSEKEKMRKSENYYKKNYSFSPLSSILDILKEQYESGKLSKKDSDKALELIEEISLTNINEGNNFGFILSDFDNYMTGKIRKALAHAIDNPVYSSDGLESYMRLQDTACIDTTGIPPNIRVRYGRFGSHLKN
jgi:hypothetical protein